MIRSISHTLFVKHRQISYIFPFPLNMTLEMRVKGDRMPHPQIQRVVGKIYSLFR